MAPWVPGWVSGGGWGGAAWGRLPRSLTFGPSPAGACKALGCALAMCTLQSGSFPWGRGTHTLLLVPTQTRTCPAHPRQLILLLTPGDVFLKRTADSSSRPLERCCHPVTAFQQLARVTSGLPCVPSLSNHPPARARSSRGLAGACPSKRREVTRTHARPPGRPGCRGGGGGCCRRGGGSAVSRATHLWLCPYTLCGFSALSPQLVSDRARRWRLACGISGTRRPPQRAPIPFLTTMTPGPCALWNIHPGLCSPERRLVQSPAVWKEARRGLRSQGRPGPPPLPKEGLSSWPVAAPPPDKPLRGLFRLSQPRHLWCENIRFHLLCSFPVMSLPLRQTLSDTPEWGSPYVVTTAAISVDTAGSPGPCPSGGEPAGPLPCRDTPRGLLLRECPWVCLVRRWLVGSGCPVTGIETVASRRWFWAAERAEPSAEVSDQGLPAAPPHVQL